MRATAAVALVLVLALLTPAVGSADELEDLEAFQAANLLYQDEYYAEAARSYEYLVGLRYDDPTLYYNLGNSYYRSGDIGRAVLNYVRAEVLAPFDQDIQTNLGLARERIVEPVSEISESSALGQLAESVPWISFNMAAAASLLLWLLLGAVVLAYIVSVRLRRSAKIGWILGVLAVGLLAFGTLSVGKYVSRSHWSETAVITTELTDVMSGPGSRHGSRFSLSAGNMVRVLDTRAGWTRIAVEGSAIDGWVVSSDAETVVRTVN